MKNLFSLGLNMEAKGESCTTFPFQQLPSVVSPSTRITPNLLKGKTKKIEPIQQELLLQ